MSAKAYASSPSSGCFSASVRSNSTAMSSYLPYTASYERGSPANLQSYLRSKDAVDFGLLSRG